MHDLTPIRISASAIPAALDKARQYRSLLEPEQAESICLDILEVDPDHLEAQRMLILALTDQFSHSGQMLDAKRVLKRVDVLPDEYERLYYRGLVSERRGRAMLNESMSRSFTYEYFREAMQLYAQAQELSPENNDDAILRWNACLRTIRRQRLEPRAERMTPFERVNWTKAVNDIWLAGQAYEAMTRGIETGAAVPAVPRGKLAVSELAETALTSLSRAIGGASYSRSGPFGQWMQDVRALGFLRPPWPLAYDRLFEASFGD